MSEFEKELLNKVGPHDRTHNGNELFLGGVIAEHFKDWQPPKQLVVVPQIMADFIEENFKDWQPPKTLVVIPRIVASYIETEEDNDRSRVGTLVYGHYKAVDGYGEYSELNKWIAYNFDTFLEAIVNGYTVEKEKKYILKHINLSEQYKNESLYLSHSRYAKLKHESYSKGADMSKFKQCHFTQSEIDDMEVGSYEQIEVEP